MFHFKVVSDTGNSTTKMMLRNERDEVVLFQAPTVINQLVGSPIQDEEELDTFMNHLTDNLIVEFDSPSLTLTGTYLVGKKAFEEDGILDILNIKVEEKYAHNLTVALPLALISANAVQEYYKQEQEIPNEIEVKADFLTAIPVANFVLNKAITLEERFKNHTHIIYLYILDKKVKVTIRFDFVKVIREGIPAIFALVEKVDILKAIGQYDPKFNLHDENLLMIDIGDGTLETIFIEQGEIRVRLSDGEKIGVGYAAEKAMENYREKYSKNQVLDRQRFMNIVRNPRHIRNKQAVEELNQMNHSQAQAVLLKTQELYNGKLAGNVSGIVVFGGGAIVFAPCIKEQFQQFADSVDCKLLWIDSEDAVNINVYGLDAMLNNIYLR